MTPRAHTGRSAAPAVRAVGGSTLALGVVLALGAVSLACGPSMQNIYEGNLRFEHCYRLDLDLEITSSHREACWKNWLGTHSHGQTRDRIEYARRRIRSLGSGDLDRPVLSISGRPREARQFYLSVPAPTSAHAPPPPIATHWYGASNAASGETAPGDECAGDCREVREECLTRCDGGGAGGDAGPASPGRADEPLAPADASANGPQTDSAKSSPDARGCRCDVDYKACVRRCFDGD